MKSDNKDVSALSGRFITFEGGEGVGKSTNVAFLKKYLEQKGKEVVVTREPGGTPLAEKMRALLLQAWQETILPDTELLLFFAGRLQHLSEVIIPALSAGRWVICDRFLDATYAYQGYGRGIALERIKALTDWCGIHLRPDLTILLDLPVAMGQQRAAERGAPDRFEAEQTVFFDRVRQGYLHMAQLDSDRYRLIDASAPLMHVQQALQQAVEGLTAVVRM